MTTVSTLCIPCLIAVLILHQADHAATNIQHALAFVKCRLHYHVGGILPG